MRSFKSELLDQEMGDLLRHFLGSTRPIMVVLAALSLMSLGWFADSLYGVVDSQLRSYFTDTPSPSSELWALLLATPFLLVLTALIVMAKRARRRLDFRVVGSSDPQGVRALVVFLSEPEAKHLPHDLELGGWLDDASTRAQIRGKWRMPAEAVAFHAFTPGSALRDVIIVGSAGEKGSQPRAAEFRRWLERLWPAGPNVRLRLLEELLPEEVPEGVDAFDLESLVQVFDEIFRRLEAEGVPRHRVVIDITGGTKLVTAACVAVALAEGRRFQYVDTHSYAVKLFDPTYQPRREAT